MGRPDYMRWRWDSKMEPRRETTLSSATPNNRAYTIKDDLPNTLNGSKSQSNLEGLVFNSLDVSGAGCGKGKADSCGNTMTNSWSPGALVLVLVSNAKRRSRFAPAPPFFPTWPRLSLNTDRCPLVTSCSNGWSHLRCVLSTARRRRSFFREFVRY